MLDAARRPTGGLASVDLYVQWIVNPKLSARVSVNNLAPADNESLTQTSDGYASNSLRSGRSSFNIGVEIKL